MVKRMRLKFDTMFRGFLIFLVICSGWGLWAGAQPATNQNTAGLTNQPPALLRSVADWDGRYQTFGLDRVPALRVSFLGEPLWKYPASLIYILLAFCVAKIIDVVFFAWIKRLTANSRASFVDLVLETLRVPV